MPREQIQYVNPNGWVSGIYKISAPNGYYYYGSTKGFKKRFREHLLMLHGNKHTNPKMQNVYNKHPTGWIFETVKPVSPDIRLLKLNEQPYITEGMGSLYCMNINPASSIPPSQKGRVPWNKGSKGIMVAWNKGVPVTLEKRERIRQTLINKAKERGPRVWINNGKEFMRISLTLLANYTAKGWSRGMIRGSKA